MHLAHLFADDICEYAMVPGTVSADEWRMSNLVDQVVEAMKATELDCASWDPDCLRELARAAIETVRPGSGKHRTHFDLPANRATFRGIA